VAPEKNTGEASATKVPTVSEVKIFSC